MLPPCTSSEIAKKTNEIKIKILQKHFDTMIDLVKLRNARNRPLGKNLVLLKEIERIRSNVGQSCMMDMLLSDEIVSDLLRKRKHFDLNDWKGKIANEKNG